MSYEGNRLSTAIKLANRVVYRKAMLVRRLQRHGHHGRGAVLFASGRPEMTYGHVGDSRLYLIRGDTIAQLTRDDSWSLEPGSRPGDTAVMKNILTKALGAREEVDFDVVGRRSRPGTSSLLCSDGLTNMVSDPEILRHRQRDAATWARRADALVDEANARAAATT